MSPTTAPTRPPYLWFGTAALAVFGVYILLSPPVSGFGDSSELTLALATNGVPHPTGYPLYVLLGHPFVAAAHAMGLDWSRGAALWSALGAGLAIYFLQIVAWRLGGLARGVELPSRVLFSTGMALCFAFNPIWLERAEQAEVYTWHIAWAGVAIAYFLGRFEIGSGAKATSLAKARTAVIWGLLVGVGLAHHRTSVLLSLPLTVALLWRVARERGPGRATLWAAIAVGSALLPLTSYDFVAWRAFHPAAAQWDVLGPSWSSVVDHVDGLIYWDYVGYFAPDHDARALLGTATYPWLFPGLLALLWISLRPSGRPDRPGLAGPVAAGLVSTLAAFRYGVPDPQSYFLMPLFLGMAALASVFAELSTRVPSRRVRSTVQVLIFVAVSAWIAYGAREWSKARATIVHNDGVLRVIWSSFPDDSSLVFWPSDAYTKLVENQVFRGEKRGLFVMNPNSLGFEFPRRRFRERFGVDPLEGFDFEPIPPGLPDEATRIRQLDARLAWHVNSLVRSSVFYMEPERKLLVRLRKRGETP